ncbi:MAG: hypothetical protein RR922_05315 [Clostridia bacterium]
MDLAVTIYIGIMFYAVVLSIIFIAKGNRTLDRKLIKRGWTNFILSITMPIITILFLYSFDEPNKTTVILNELGSMEILSFALVAGHAVIVLNYIFAIYSVTKREDRKLYD